MPQVFVAAGSNVEPERNLAQAAAELERAFGEVRFSPWYRNRAVGFEGDDFINLVVGFDTELPLAEVISRLRQIETLCGRPRNAPKWAPRTMDLDILLYGDVVRSEPGLTLPRPDLARRAYMLKPMVDLAPMLVHPTLHKPLRELWDELERREPHAMQVVTIPRSGRRPPPASDR